MKKYILFFAFCLSFSLMLQAQINKTIHISAGEIFGSIPHDELESITSLTILGTLNASDFPFLRDSLPSLTELDISGVNIVAYKGYVYYNFEKEYPANSLPEFAFSRTDENIPYLNSLKNLNSVIFPPSLISIGDYAFNGCSGLKSLTIPSSVVSIGEGAFKECTSLTILGLPSSLTSIGPIAFRGCTGLTTVNLPTSLKSIGSAFAYCTGLKQVVLPESITSLKAGAFLGCTGLTSVIIPSKVTIVEDDVFSNCTNLTTVSILSPTMWTNNNLFYNCSKVTSLTVAWTIPPPLMSNVFYLIDRNTCTLHVPNGTTSKYRADADWNQFKNIVEPSNGLYVSATSARLLSAGSTATVDVTSKAAWTASSDQTWLAVSPGSGTGNKTLTLTAQSNTSIGSRIAIVTVSSTGLESTTITITQNGADAILSNVTAGSLINAYTTEQLNTMTNLSLKGIIDARDFKTIRDKMPLLSTLDLSGVTIAAYQGSEGTNVDYSNPTYPANTIPSYAFYSSVVPSKITSLVLPASVTGFGDGVFGWGLTSLKVNNPLPIVFDYYNNELTPLQQNCTLYVPYGCLSRYAAAEKWKDIVHVKEALVGFNLSSYNDMIAGAEGTTRTIDITANVAWSISTDQDWLVVNPATGNGNQKLTFTASANQLFTKRQATVTVTGEGVSSQTTIITQEIQPQPEKILEVTAGSLATALSNDELGAISILTLKGTIDARDFKTMRDSMPLLSRLDLGGVTIVAYTGLGGTSLNGSTTYPANSIPETAFYSHSSSTGNYIGKISLTSIIFPSTLTSFGYESLAKCNGIKEIVIPSSVASICNYAFESCEGLISVSIPSSVKSIGSCAFQFCKNLSSVNIPSSITSIGSYAFDFCTNLSSVTIPSSVTTIGNYAFEECQKLTSVTVNWPIPLSLGTYSFIFLNVNTSTAILNVPYGTTSSYAAANQWKDFRNIKELAGFLLSAKDAKIDPLQGSTTSVDIQSNMEWTVTSDQAWLTVSPTSGTGLGQKLTFTAEANPLFTPRTANVTVSATGIESQTVTITQSPAPRQLEMAAGGLSSALTLEELNTITNLTLTGTIDARDFKTMRDKMPSLAKLDLSDATIVAYNGTEGTSQWGNWNYLANTIPEFAFYNNVVGKTTLSSIVFPQSMTSIAQYAFSQCNGLTDILIPSKVTTIAQLAFYKCNGLKALTIPSSVTSIGSQSFYSCINLRSISVESSIPPDLNNSYGVFNGVDKSLCVLNVPYKSTGAYRNAYQWKDFQKIAEPLNGFILSSTAAKVDGTAESKAILQIDANIEWTASSDQDWLVVNPISGTGIQTLTLTADTNPSFITTRTAFVTVSTTVPGVASQKITVTQSAQPQPPKTLELTAGGLAFALTEVELATITDLTLTGSIDARDFKTMRDKMPLLAKLNLSGATIAAYNGTEGTSTIGNTDYPDNTIPEYAFVNTVNGLQGKSSLTSIVLPESLTAIGPYSFSVCQSLTNVIIPLSVTDIGSYAFYGCSSIYEITIPTAVSNIGVQAFGKFNGSLIVEPDNLNYMISNNVLFNKAQTEIIQCSISKNGSYTIPSTVTSIGSYAFSECTNLTSVTIPTSVTFIGESAFALCIGLKSIYARAISPINLDSSPNVFNQIYFYNCTLYVPVGSKSAYQAANQWKDFPYIVEINPDLIANAGPNKTIDEGKFGILEGSVSVNTSGHRVTYKWTAPAGITLSSDTIANPTFTAPEVPYYTDFTFSLTISDGLNYSAADEVVITVNNVYKAPVANAGPDQTVDEKTKVKLDGSASNDPNHNYLSYQWTAPAGISLNSYSVSKPTFIAPKVTSDTDFLFVLQVYNGMYYKSDTVVITVKHVNTAPVAYAGNIQYVSKGETVTLDGTYSMDEDGDALTYLWTAPEGITLSSVTSPKPYFTAPKVKTDTFYIFTLVVNDGKLNSTASQVTIWVRDIPAILCLLATRHRLETPPVQVNYKLFMKEGDTFIQKIDTFAVMNDSLFVHVETGEWIVQAAPARDPSAFVATYVGNVLNWNEAEIINVPDKSTIYREITCIVPEIAKTGIGQISGVVYEKPGGGTKSVSISGTNSSFSSPIQNALVRLYKKGSAIPVYSIYTDSLGAYQFDRLELSEYEIVVELPGYTQSGKFTIALSTIKPVTNAYFAVDTSSQVITDNPSVKVSLITVYPNPTKGIIHIDGLSGKMENRISIYTIEGKQVMEKITHLMSETIDMSDQISGTYIVMVNKERFKIFKK